MESVFALRPEPDTLMYYDPPPCGSTYSTILAPVASGSLLTLYIGVDDYNGNEQRSWNVADMYWPVPANSVSVSVIDTSFRGPLVLTLEFTVHQRRRKLERL